MSFSYTLTHISRATASLFLFKIINIETNLSLCILMLFYSPAVNHLVVVFNSALSSSWGTDEVKRITQQLCPAPALQILGFQAPKNTTGATLGSVITNVPNPALP